MRLGGLTRAPKRTNQYAKAYEEVRQGVLTGCQGEWSKNKEHFQKALQLFKNALSSFQVIIFRIYQSNFKVSLSSRFS